MSQTISRAVTVAATQAHRQFGGLICRVYLGKEHFIIEKGGLPVAVILSVAEHSELVRGCERHEQETQVRPNEFREAAQAIGAEIDKLGLTDEQVMLLLEETARQMDRRNSGHTFSQRT